MKRMVLSFLFLAGVLIATRSKSQTNIMADKAGRQLKMLLQFQGLWGTNSAI